MMLGAAVTGLGGDRTAAERCKTVGKETADLVEELR